MIKKRAVVLFGGVSSEYEVSLRSAESVISNIPRDRFEVVPVGILKDGQWFRYTGPVDKIGDGSWAADAGNRTPAVLSPDRVHGGLGLLHAGGPVEWLSVDVVFPVLHGRNGEDGTVQGLLALSGIPCVGCGVLASAVCMDKAVTNTILDHHGIARAPWAQLSAFERGSLDARIPGWEGRFGYPMFVKPANAGSSVGISRAENRAALVAAVDLAFEHDDKILVERTVVGQELEVSVIGNERPTASVVGEILSANVFYDYEAKYLSERSRTLIPANITPQQQAAIQKTAVEAYLLLGCRGFARIDFLLESATGNIYLNEVNTIPGFTSISMFPKMLIASGFTYAELVEKLLDLAMEEQI